MLLALFFLLYSDTIDPPTRYDGRAGKLAVRVPRLEVEPAIDGEYTSERQAPGTVLFAGSGSTLRDPTVLGRARLRRSEDGFFLKLSYLFRM